MQIFGMPMQDDPTPCDRLIMSPAPTARQRRRADLRHMTTAVSAHSLTARLFHWGFLALFTYGLIKQVDELEELDDPAFLREEMLFAVVFLAVLVARFIFMRSTRPTALPVSADARVRKLAAIVHNGMYASLALLALSGLAIGGLYGSGVSEGGLLAVVLWLHEACYWACVITIGIHIAGALYHRHLGDGIWSSMVPVPGERARHSDTAP